MQYRRANTPGASYFFIVNLANRRSKLLTTYTEELRSAFKQTQKNHPFVIEAIVILPEHLHCILTFPENDADFATRWRLIKSTFSRAIPKTERISQSRLQKSERGIWQRRYWEHLIRDENDFEKHVNYIHFNPVKHRHVSAPVEWPHSSIHRAIREGITPSNWAAENEIDGNFGEPPSSK